MTREPIEIVNEKLRAKFGDEILSAEMEYDYPVVTVRKEHILEIVRFLYDDEELQFQFLTDLCGIHFPENKGHELGVVYHLHNLSKNLRLRLKLYTGINDLAVHSITSIFAGANWMERETFDFFGIHFIGHPNLKRILNVNEMNYHPLRKEYPLEDATRKDKDDSMFGR